MSITSEDGENPNSEVKREEKIYDLSDRRISFRYEGDPIEIRLGASNKMDDAKDSALMVGRPDDLGNLRKELIARGCDPKDFVIVQKKWMERTRNSGNPRGFLILKDGTTRFVGSPMPMHPSDTFTFGSGVSRMHVGITRKGDTLTIGDLNGLVSGLETKVITANLPTPNPSVR